MRLPLRPERLTHLPERLLQILVLEHFLLQPLLIYQYELINSLNKFSDQKIGLCIPTGYTNLFV